VPTHRNDISAAKGRAFSFFSARDELLDTKDMERCIWPPMRVRDCYRRSRSHTRLIVKLFARILYTQLKIDFGMRGPPKELFLVFTLSLSLCYCLLLVACAFCLMGRL
jgi:hypothetical protein